MLSLASIRKSKCKYNQTYEENLEDIAEEEEEKKEDEIL